MGFISTPASCVNGVCGKPFLLHTRPSGVALLQSLELSLATNQILVIPLDVARLGQPSPECLSVHLIGDSVSRLGSLERAFLLQSFLFEGLTTPEEQAHAVFQLAVADNRVAVEKPHGMRVPYFVLRIRQGAIDLFGEKPANRLIARRLRLIVLLRISV